MRDIIKRLQISLGRCCIMSEAIAIFDIVFIPRYMTILIMLEKRKSMVIKRENHYRQNKEHEFRRLNWSSSGPRCRNISPSHYL